MPRFARNGRWMTGELREERRRTAPDGWPIIRGRGGLDSCEQVLQAFQHRERPAVPDRARYPVDLFRLAEPELVLRFHNKLGCEWQHVAPPFLG